MNATDLQVLTYNQCDSSLRDRFEQWVLSMTVDEYGETGSGPDGALEWVRMHNKSFTPTSVHQTFIFVEAFDDTSRLYSKHYSYSKE